MLISLATSPMTWIGKLFQDAQKKFEVPVGKDDILVHNGKLFDK